MVSGLHGSEFRPIRVAVDRAAAQSTPEISYVIRTLLTTAGYPWIIEWADRTTDPVDIAYGRQAWDRAAIRIPAVQWPFRYAPQLEPSGSIVHAGIPLLRFDQEKPVAGDSAQRLEFPVDLLFNAYWWLTGAREPFYQRDRRDNLFLGSSVVRRDGLLARPCVSLAATLLRQHLTSAGRPAREPGWRSAGAEAAFSFTHDVDYPEIIRWIEAPRALSQRGLRGARLAIDILTGTSHYWTFREWIDFEREFGTRPTFYFMARQGSLWQYLTGTPDDFYDIASPRFQALFGELRDAGCEIGLHASYHAHRSSEQLRQERVRVESLAGVTGIGNRHHYWHLDPDDPNETLRRHEEAGLAYDSSLEFECYPGFRRGICHPFRVYHPGLRRELRVPQIPPAWMDDHFDRRLAENRIAEPELAARALLDVVRATAGVAVVDYHSRGMNKAVYPRYGEWLRAFAAENLDRRTKCLTPTELVAMWLEHEKGLMEASEDRLGADVPVSPRPVATLRVRRAAPDDAGAIARIYIDAFPALRLSRMGAAFAARYFERLLRASQSLGVVALDERGECAGFAVGYAGRSQEIRRWLLRRPIGLALSAAGSVMRRPGLLFDIFRGAAAQGTVVSDARGAFLVSIAIAKASRGAGTGRMLLTAFVEDALRAGAETVWLEVAPDREAAMHLYQSSGFERAGAAGTGSDSPPTVLMRLKLRNPDSGPIAS